MDCMKIGDVIRQARIQSGYRSQTQLARAMGVSQNLVSRWERAHDVNTSTLRKLAEYITFPPFVFADRDLSIPDGLAVGEADARILAMVPQEMKEAVAAILADPDGARALNEWLRLFAEAPEGFRQALKDLIVSARRWPEEARD